LFHYVPGFFLQQISADPYMYSAFDARHEKADGVKLHEPGIVRVIHDHDIVHMAFTKPLRPILESGQVRPVK